MNQAYVPQLRCCTDARVRLRLLRCGLPYSGIQYDPLIMTTSDGNAFGSAILSDRYLHNLLHQADMEGYLASDAPYTPIQSWIDERLIQEALAHLIVFDELLMLSTYDEGDSLLPHVPVLEDEGLLRVLPISSGAGREIDHSDTRAVAEGFYKHARHLESYASVRPFVLNRLVRQITEHGDVGLGFLESLSEATGLSFEKAVSAVLDYCTYGWLDLRDGTDRQKKIKQLLGSQVTELIDELKGEAARSQAHESGSVNRILEMILSEQFASEDVLRLIDVSIREGAGVASFEYNGPWGQWERPSVWQADTTHTSHTFCLIRCALEEEGRYFPRIDGIKHALTLRRDPNLRALKSQILLFREHLGLGDREALARIRGEIREASRSLEIAGVIDTAETWATVVSLPVAAAEMLTYGGSVAGTILSVFSVAALAMSSSLRSGRQWVFFGTGR